MDGGLIQSKSVAIQIGDETRAPMSTLVFQNITIQQSHRCACSAFHPDCVVSISEGIGSSSAAKEHPGFQGCTVLALGTWFTPKKSVIC